MQQGIILLDECLNAQFMNRSVRALWGVPIEQAERKPPYVELVGDFRRTGAYDIPGDHLDQYIEDRIALVRARDPSAVDK